MFFCPMCANLLLIQAGGEGNELYCQTCPYIMKIDKPIRTRTYFERKKVDDVLGAEDNTGWQETDVQCARPTGCDGLRALFMQLQIRSADEPMTTFYRCKTCKYNWREN